MPGERESWRPCEARRLLVQNLRRFVVVPGVGVRIFPPGNPFSPEEIYGLYDSKSLPPERIC